ncbi:MAG: hypothetical protein F6K19_44445 [Cyanothece sp. SIO1E1]|nr:hypothetical protein [Cyanothece sp. SIO1E1]
MLIAKRNWLIVGMAGLVAMGFAGVALVSIAPFKQAIPEPVYACLPHSIQSAQLSGQVEDGQGIYYLVGVNLEEQYQEFLIQVDAQQQCQSLLPAGEFVLSQYIPINLARELVLQHYTQAIEGVGDRHTFQQQLIEQLTVPADRSFLTEDDVWALKQLDIKLPPDSYDIFR